MEFFSTMNAFQVLGMIWVIFSTAVMTIGMPYFAYHGLKVKIAEANARALAAEVSAKLAESKPLEKAVAVK